MLLVLTFCKYPGNIIRRELEYNLHRLYIVAFMLFTLATRPFMPSLYIISAVNDNNQYIRIIISVCNFLNLITEKILASPFIIWDL